MGLLCNLKQNPEILEEYNSIVQKQLKLGTVEMVKENDASSGNCALPAWWSVVTRTPPRSEYVLLNLLALP